LVFEVKSEKMRVKPSTIFLVRFGALSLTRALARERNENIKISLT
jgi:hypothetical protein